MYEPAKLRAFSLWFERANWVLCGAWTIVIAVSLAWNVIQTRNATLEAARIQARAAYEKDIMYRRWSAKYGGVYMPVTEDSQPNPYLSDMPERDITTPSSKLLTLFNPAYMTRQVYELAAVAYGIRGHITSLNPVRPGNAPDPWEVEALGYFERGEAEVNSIAEIEGKEYMRLMRPLVTETGCLKCHAAQGYREGEIRGGISVSVPMEPLRVLENRNFLTLGLAHLLLWLIGMGGISLGVHQLRKSERERQQAELRLEYLSTHDSLTGLHNRTFFQEELARLEHSRQFPVTVIIADVDGLKGVNVKCRPKCATRDRMMCATRDRMMWATRDRMVWPTPVRLDCSPVRSVAG